MEARLPVAGEQAVITEAVAVGDDSALPARDKRARAAISAKTSIAPGTTVYVGREPRRMGGPGRGNGWALLGWVDEQGSCCVGTFHETQIAVQPEGVK